MSYLGNVTIVGEVYHMHEPSLTSTPNHTPLKGQNIRDVEINASIFKQI